ncbi:MAG: hypothetical protein AAGE18_04400 [Pseudomonadota bacterium]
MLGIAGAAAAAPLATPAIAQGLQLLRLEAEWPEETPVTGNLAARLAERIAATSGGRLTVEIVPPSAPAGGASSGAFERAASGQIDACLGAPGAWAAQIPAMAVFGPVPCGLTPREVEAWIHGGDGQLIWDQVAMEAGIKPVLLGDTVTGLAGWFRRVPATAEDLSGLRMRVSGLGVPVLTALGGRPVDLAPEEIAGALRGERIDASESLGIAYDRTLGLTNSGATGLTPALFAPSGAVALAFNLRWWDGLPAETRAMVETCALAENDWLAARVLDSWSRGFARASGEGTRFADVAQPLWSAVAEASDAVLADLAAEDRFTAYAVDAFRQFRQDVGGWTLISEGAYSEARARALDLDS